MPRNPSIWTSSVYFASITAEVASFFSLSPILSEPSLETLSTSLPVSETSFASFSASIVFLGPSNQCTPPYTGKKYQMTDRAMTPPNTATV